MMDYCHFQSTEFFHVFFIITHSHAWITQCFIRHTNWNFQMLAARHFNSCSSGLQYTIPSKLVALSSEPPLWNSLSPPLSLATDTLDSSWEPTWTRLVSLRTTSSHQSAGTPGRSKALQSATSMGKYIYHFVLVKTNFIQLLSTKICLAWNFFFETKQDYQPNFYLLFIACYWYSAVVCLSWVSHGNLVGSPVFMKFHA